MNHEIRCDVDTCKYNEMGQACSLNSIMVSSSTISQATDKEETGCMSFEN